MLYESAYNTSAKELSNYKVPKHEHTHYWEGVKHQDLIRMVRKVSKERDLKVTGEHFQVANNRDTLFDSWDFEQGVPGVKGMNMSLGYRGSNAFRFAHTFVVGARVAVCQNGMISGEFGYKKRHSDQLDLYELVNNAFDRYLEEVKTIRPMVAGMQKLQITNEKASEIMLDSARIGIISWSRLQIVDEHWRDSPHKQFKGRTAWSLYNAFTQCAKKTSPRSQIEIMRDIPPLIRGEIEIEK